MSEERQIIISINEKGNLDLKTDKFSTLDILGILETVKHVILVKNTNLTRCEEKIIDERNEPNKDS